MTCCMLETKESSEINLANSLAKAGSLEKAAIQEQKCTHLHLTSGELEGCTSGVFRDKIDIFFFRETNAQVQLNLYPVSLELLEADKNEVCK